MKILFFDWTTFGDQDIVAALHELGYEVVFSQQKPKLDANDSEFVESCQNMLVANAVNLVFTSNFIPVVAEACYRVKVKYMSWVYDSPQMLLYNKQIVYPTNYVFLFDSQQYEDLKRKGINTVYYMPLAANGKRMDKLQVSEEDKRRYSCDIAFVGSLYNEEHNFYDRMKDKLSDYDRGYLEAMMYAQQNVYGYYFLEEMLYGNPVLNAMDRAMPYEISEDNFASKEYCYGNYFLGRKLASIERLDKLKRLSECYQVNVYTSGNTSSIPRLNNKGCVEYYEEMPLVFRCAKININITLRTIQNGIPLRCFDIMGSGGFLLTNFQQDFQGLFEEGVDYVSYDSCEDMMKKTTYYLTHEEEREKIAQHGHETILREHSYVDRLKEMLIIVEEDRLIEG